MTKSSVNNPLILVAAGFTLLACAGGAATTKAPTIAPTVPAQTSYSDYFQRTPMAHQVGNTTVGPDGKPLRLRGVSLGGWPLWEGWEFRKGLLLSESTIMDRLTQLVGTADATAFQNQIYANHISEADLARIARLRFNSVRIPINARILEEEEHPYAYRQFGWDILDRVLAWCDHHNVYAVLDLHAVPGGQSRLSPSDPSDQLVWKSQENQKRAVTLWQAMAARYKACKIVIGYDLINEPLPPTGQDLANLEGRIVAAIRQADPYHMVIVEGGRFSSDFAMLPTPLSGNQAYGFHMSNRFGDDRKKKLDYFKSVADFQNVPLWVGEFGENTYDMIGTTVQMYDDPANEMKAGWCYWRWKKTPGRFLTPVAIGLPASCTVVIDWLSSPSKNKPDRNLVLNGINDFVQAVRLENTHLDQKMHSALTS